MGDASTVFPCTDKYHLILNNVIWHKEGNIRIQAQCVDLSIKLMLTQINTHQSNSCSGPVSGARQVAALYARLHLLQLIYHS